MDVNDIAPALEMVSGANPPAYIGLLNEPDYSFEGKTATLDPAAAGQALAKFFSTPHPQTKYLSPAVAYWDWMQSFHKQFPYVTFAQQDHALKIF